MMIAPFTKSMLPVMSFSLTSLMNVSITSAHATSYSPAAQSSETVNVSVITTEPSAAIAASPFSEPKPNARSASLFTRLLP